MPTRFFRMMATDIAAVPGSGDLFEPTTQFNGHWSGVIAATSDELIDRLVKRGCLELTQAKYEEEVKKKAALQPILGDFRQVMGVLDARPVANPQQASTASPPPPAEPPPVEQVIKPAVVPRRRSVAQ